MIFDESIVIRYACEFDASLPQEGMLRGIATADVFTKSDQIFHTRQGFDLATDTMAIATPQPEPASTTTSTTTSTTVPQDAPPATLQISGL